MATLRFHQATTLTPEQYIAGLTDFGPGRSKLFGNTDIDVVVVRDGKNIKGKLLGFVIGTIGKRQLEKAFENSVKAIEAHNNGGKPGPE